MKNKNKVQLALDELWGGTITHFYHDLLNHRLTFGVMVTKVETTIYKVSIDEISTIIFDEPDIEVTEDYNWVYMGMTSIDYSPDCGFGYFPHSPDYKYSPGDDPSRIDQAEKEKEAKKVGAFNLLMDVNETGVYIRAKRLQINEKVFQLL